MTTEPVAKIGDEAALEILKGIDIPSEPTVLIELRRELQNDYPDMQVLSNLIRRDVALSAAVIKTVNSALYGLKHKADTVQQAMSMLGLNSIANIITGFVYLQTVQKSSKIALPRYWDSAENIALISSSMAHHLKVAQPDEAYTLGLFHDCGIAILAQKYPNYKEILQQANTCRLDRFTDLEDQHYGTNHAVVGYFVGKTWRLPKVMREVILKHHEPVEIILGRDRESTPPFQSLFCILTLANRIEYLSRGDNTDRRLDSSTSLILDYLGLSELDYWEMCDDMLEEINA